MSYMPRKILDEVYVGGTDPGLTAGYELWYDTAAADPPGPNYIAKSGDTGIGPLSLAADPAVALGVTTKQYVDAEVTVATTNPVGLPSRDGILWIKVIP